MSGSGGRYYDLPSRSTREWLAASEDATKRADYDQRVNELLSDCLKAFNDRDIDAISKHLKTLVNALKDKLDSAIQLIFGGSISKHTYVNGLSDVDVLACLRDESLIQGSPRQAIEAFAATIRQRLPTTSVKAGDLAVTVEFSDGHAIQILPAVKTPQGYRIANASQDVWSNVIRPQRFAEKLTSINQAKNGKVVPIVKLAKQMNEQLPAQLRLTGYHLESIAIEAFERYGGSLRYKDMLVHYWQRASTIVLEPITDHTGQSIHVDDYLGARGCQARANASSAINRLVEKLERADRRYDTTVWDEVLAS